MDDIEGFYERTLGKDSALFIGTLWLGMIAKQMDDVRKAEDEAYNFRGEFIYKWLNKLRVLYDNVEFKTYIPSYKDEIKFMNIKFDNVLNKFNDFETKIMKKDMFVIWFDKIQILNEILWKIEDNEQNKKSKFDREMRIITELGKCQREFYLEIEKKHLIMPPEKEDMKTLASREWIDRDNPNKKREDIDKHE
jgi:hypothetical protein